jgi:hypothetical protein
MTFATALVAAVGNVSAVLRLRAIARCLRRRDARQATSLRKSDSSEGVAPPHSTKDAGTSAPVTRTGPNEVRRAASG